MLTHVPIQVPGEHAEKDMGVRMVFGTYMDRALTKRCARSGWEVVRKGLSMPIRLRNISGTRRFPQGSFDNS